MSGVVVARSLGPENRGYFALVTLVPMVVAEVANLGLPAAMTYEIARGVDTRRVTLKLRPVFMAQLACATILNAGILYAITRGDARSVEAAALIAVAIVPATLALRYSLALLQGMQRFTEFNLLRVAPATLNSAVLFLLWLLHDARLVAITFAYTLTTISAACAAVWVARRAAKAGTRVGTAPEPAELSTLVRFGVTGFLGVASPLETFRLDQASVGLFLSAQGLGLYVIAVSITNLPRFVAQSVGMVAYPDIASAVRGEARRRTLRFMGIAAATSGVMVLALEVAAGRLIPFFFGSVYADAVTPARILLVAALLLGVRRVLGDCARGAGRPVVGTAAEAASWLALVPALAVLAPTHGIVGVAWAVFAASCVSAAVAVALAFAPRERPDLKSAAFYAAPALLAIATGLVLADFLTLSADVVTVAALVAAAFGIAVLLAQPGVDRHFDLLNPAIGAGLMLLVLFVLRPAYVLGGAHYRYQGHDIRSEVPEAALISAVGIWAFVLGYRWMSSRFKRRPTQPPRENRYDPSTRASVAGGLLVVGTGLFVANLARGGSVSASLHLLAAGRSANVAGLAQGSTQYLTVAPILATAGAMMLIATAGNRATGGVERFLIFASITFPVAAFSLLGQRRFLLPALAGPAVVWLLARRRRPPWLGVIIVVPVMFLAVATLSSVRSAGARAQAGGAEAIARSAVSSPGKVAHTFIAGPDNEMFSAFATELETLGRGGAGNFAYGRASVGDLVLSPVPSRVLPGKPQSQQDRLLTLMFGGPCRPIGGLCPDVSSLGTFYEDFWIPGVFIGMLLLGAFSAAVYGRYWLRGDAGSMVILASAVIYLPIVLRAGFMPGAEWFLFLVVPSWLAVKIVGADGHEAHDLEPSHLQRRSSRPAYGTGSRS